MHELKKGMRFILRGSGVATVARRYYGVPYGGTEDDYQVLVDLFFETRAKLTGLTETMAKRRGRPLMSSAEAFQVMGIVMNRIAPMTNMALPLRLRQAKKALKQQDPLELAHILRELRMRAENRQGVPIRIYPREQAIQQQIAKSLCDELKVVLPDVPTWFPCAE